MQLYLKAMDPILTFVSHGYKISINMNVLPRTSLHYTAGNPLAELGEHVWDTCIHVGILNLPALVDADGRNQEVLLRGALFLHSLEPCVLKHCIT